MSRVPFSRPDDYAVFSTGCFGLAALRLGISTRNAHPPYERDSTQPVKYFDTYAGAKAYAKAVKAGNDQWVTVFVIQYDRDYTDKEMTDMSRTIRKMPPGEIDPNRINFAGNNRNVATMCRDSLGTVSWEFMNHGIASDPETALVKYVEVDPADPNSLLVGLPTNRRNAFGVIVVRKTDWNNR